MIFNRSFRNGRAARRGAVLLLLAGPLGACGALDRALDVEAPSRIPAGELENPARARLLLNGAIGDFECALGSYVVASGMLSGEIVDATQTAARWSYERRNVRPDESLYSQGNCAGLGVYTPISTARWTADNVLKNLEIWTDAQVADRTRLIATAAAYAGYSYILLGEGFCTAAVDAGPELTQAQVLEIAVQRFTRAIEAAQAAGAEDILNMARVGRARALLDLGRVAEAGADAALVPESFDGVYASASNASARRQNRIFAQTNSGAISVAPEYRNLTFGGVADPRVAVVDEEHVATDGTPIFSQTKYTEFGSPTPIATWEEAQLILAEARLAAGNVQGAVDIINTLHERAGLPAFSSSDPAVVMSEIIEERKRELFLEGQRLADVARYDLPLTPAAGTAYRKGGTYGSQTCLPLPDVERLNNPNL